MYIREAIFSSGEYQFHFSLNRFTNPSSNRGNPLKKPQFDADKEAQSTNEVVSALWFQDRNLLISLLHQYTTTNGILKVIHAFVQII